MDDAAAEGVVQAGDGGPLGMLVRVKWGEGSRGVADLGLAEDTRGVEKDVAAVFELAGLLAREVLPQLDVPFALVFVPVAAGHLGVEGHVLAQVKDIANLVEVRPQVCGVGVEAWPVGVLVLTAQ